MKLVGLSGGNIYFNDNLLIGVITDTRGSGPGTVSYLGSDGSMQQPEDVDSTRSLDDVFHDAIDRLASVVDPGRYMPILVLGDNSGFASIWFNPKAIVSISPVSGSTIQVGTIAGGTVFQAFFPTAVFDDFVLAVQKALAAK